MISFKNRIFKLNRSKFNFTLVFILIAITMFFNLTACTEFVAKKYRADKIEVIQSYKNQKNREDYNTENWNLIDETVEKGKNSLLNAKSKLEIDKIVCNIKMEIDGVVPLKSEKILNGAYFISDESWEGYVRTSAIDKSEKWIESLISGEINESRPYYRNNFYLVIMDGKMTVNENGLVYQIVNERFIYNGSAFNSSISFWFKDGILYLKNGPIARQYLQDTSYQMTDEINILSKPTNIDYCYSQGSDGIGYVTFQWNYESTAGTLGAHTQIRKAGSLIFETVKLDQVYHNTFIIQLSSLEFKDGQNFVNIYHVGGPAITNKKTVFLNYDSAPAQFKIISNGNEPLAIEKLNN